MIRFIICLLTSIVSSCNSPALPYQNQSTRTYPVHFYIDNISETQKAIDLTVKWDTTVVLNDTVRYTGIGDLFDTYSLVIKSGPHRLLVRSSGQQLTCDTTLTVDSLTHVFISFVYTKLDAKTLKHIHDEYPLEEQAVINALSEPKRLVVSTMRGPISIP